MSILNTKENLYTKLKKKVEAKSTPVTSISRSRNTGSPVEKNVRTGRKKRVVLKRQFKILSKNLLAASISHRKRVKFKNMGPSTPSKSITFSRKGGKRFQRKKSLVERSIERKSTNWGIIYVQSTYNNTIYTLTNRAGQGKASISAGTCGFKNTRKSTSYASQAAAGKIAGIAKKLNFARIHIRIRGLGPGKLGGVRTLRQSGLRVAKIWECTTLPHNGCRPAKSRRV